MKILHLTASPFFGGPERVILDIVRTQAADFGVESLVVSFQENGGCEPFLRELDQAGIPNRVLEHDMPHLYAAYRDLVRLFRDEKIDIVCAHGHKSRLLGWRAARKVGIPIVGVSHGWTWQDWKISLYERLDQWVHRRMDAVVAVSQGQADKIVKTGTPKNRVHVIHNAIDTARFDAEPDHEYRRRLEAYFETPPERLVGAAGRLSPEKGYDVLIDAVKLLAGQTTKSFGVVLFGEGFLRETLQKRIDEANMADRFKMVGFTSELDGYLPHFDVFAQSSHTEGFPCVNVEAMAARVPVVATAVGGVPEQIVDGVTGFLVPPNNPAKLAETLAKLIDDPVMSQTMGRSGREKATSEFTCHRQAEKYFELFRKLRDRSTV